MPVHPCHFALLVSKAIAGKKDETPVDFSSLSIKEVLLKNWDCWKRDRFGKICWYDFLLERWLSRLHSNDTKRVRNLKIDIFLKCPNIIMFATATNGQKVSGRNWNAGRLKLNSWVMPCCWSYRQVELFVRFVFGRTWPKRYSRRQRRRRTESDTRIFGARKLEIILKSSTILWNQEFRSEDFWREE